MSNEKWIDIAKGIGILLIIIGHSPFSQFIKDVIYTFHIPLFFFISGYLFNWGKYKKNINQFLVNKIKRLVIPYFLTNIIILSTFYLLSYFKIYKFKSNLSIKCLIGIFYGNGAPLNPSTIFTNTINIPSWFLVCLFCGFIILCIIAYSHEKYGISFSCCLCLFLILIGFEISKYLYLPWGLDISCVSMIFMFSGYLMNYYNIHPFQNVSEKNYINLLLILILFVLIKINGSVDMNMRNYANPLVFAIGGLLGTHITIELSKEIAKKENSLSKLFIFTGKNSLTILLYHTFTPRLFLNLINIFIDVKEAVYNSEMLYLLNVLTFSMLTVLFIRKVPILKNIY